jgi:hypothetical protein
VLDGIGLEPATREDYQNWLRLRRKAIANRKTSPEAAC